MSADVTRQAVASQDFWSAAQAARSSSAAVIRTIRHHHRLNMPAPSGKEGCANRAAIDLLLARSEARC
jgi:hypothetical protein